MRRIVITVLLSSVYLFGAACTSVEQASTDKPGDVKSDARAASVGQPGEGGQGEPASGEVQERAVAGMGAAAIAPATTLKSGVMPSLPMAPPVAALPGLGTFPGEFAIQTQKGFYVTAIDGGGRTADPILVTASTTVGPWEKFKFAATYPNTPYDKTIQTARGNYVTAVNGGGLTANVFHTDATQARDWERYRLLDLGVGNFAPTYYALYTIKGFYVTAVGAGGKYADALHTDAKQIQAWEQFRIVKCGDIGSGLDYGVMAADGEFLVSKNAGGQTSQAILLDKPPYLDTRGIPYKLIRQADGSYALRTANGVNFLTALGGGGEVASIPPYDCHFYSPCVVPYPTDIFHTDATQVQAWEKFRFIDQGNCSYAIQTAKGFYAGIYKDSGGRTLLTTDRSTISANERFQLVVYGLASPVVLQ